MNFSGWDAAARSCGNQAATLQPERRPYAGAEAAMSSGQDEAPRRFEFNVFI